MSNQEEIYLGRQPRRPILVERCRLVSPQTKEDLEIRIADTAIARPPCGSSEIEGFHLNFEQEISFSYEELSPSLLELLDEQTVAKSKSRIIECMREAHLRDQSSLVETSFCSNKVKDLCSFVFLLFLFILRTVSTFIRDCKRKLRSVSNIASDFYRTQCKVHPSIKQFRPSILWKNLFSVLCLILLGVETVQANSSPRFVVEKSSEIVVNLKEGPDTPIGK